MRTLLAIPLSAIFLSLSVSSAAAVLDFEDVGTSQFDSSIPSGGYSFNFSASGWGILTNDFTGFNRVQNGSTTLAFTGNPGSVQFKPLDDSAFSLQGLDMAVFNGAFSSGSVTITGFFEAGGSTSQDVSFTDEWSTYLLGGSFVGLDSVVVTGLTFGDIDNNPGVQFDNLQINNAVPEPATFAALGLGVAALRRRRRK